MSGDLQASRTCSLADPGEQSGHREQGPADELGLPPSRALEPHALRLKSLLDGIACEQSEVCVEALGHRLGDGLPRHRFAATVRLAVRGPHTLSPILWQSGGVSADIDSWAADLARTLPAELEAIQSGQALSEPWTGTVVLDPWVASLLVHECVGHTSEADNYVAHARPAGVTLGHRWTHAALTVVDDPAEPGRIGTYAVDDEGSPAERTTLVSDGVWTGLLHNQLTARELSAPRSGNGRRAPGAASSLPRMSVVTALPGDAAVERLIGEIDDGWYCSGSWGAGSIGRRFVLRPTLARRIRNGRILPEYLRRFELRGDKFATIAAIDAVGDDTRRFDPAFGCDKDGQDGLPVSFGAPHLRLRGVTLVPLRKPQR